MQVGPSLRGWALLLLVLAVAATLRLWQLGAVPPGLYRDEAFNGLDAVGVLRGEHALFFAANNGREPAYIYLTAVAVALLGRTATAVRLAAAVAGTVTTWLTYRLGRAWFGFPTGLLAAWLWAVTLWPLHLSRIGLRPILLAPLLALTFWLGTLAYRRHQPGLWLATGLAYGATFYTYLAARFTPLLLLLLLSYLLLTRPQYRSQLWPGVLWFTFGAALLLWPLALLVWQRPALFLGRAQQVSVFSPAVNQGDFWGTLERNTLHALGMFLWKGDTILRHNPAGRPVFDLFTALPFLAGLGWCLRHWRRPAAAVLLLWLAVMLGPTILAEDTPHFLRAAGLLPAVTVVPALGLSKLWEWPKLPGALRRGLVLFLALATLTMTIHDYTSYARRPETAFLFEAAAREMAQQINNEVAGTAIFVDRRFWEGWPSLPFLVDDAKEVDLFNVPVGLPPAPSLPLALYAWPYGDLSFVPRAVTPPAAVTVQQGALARGDLEDKAYPLYVRYSARAETALPSLLARFGRQIELRDAVVSAPTPHQLQVDLYWSATGPVADSLTVFVHVLRDGNLVGQSDARPAQGYWPAAWWQPDLIVRDRHVIDLQEPYITHQQILVGFYETTTQVRLPVFTTQGQTVGDSWLLQAATPAHEER